MEISGFEPVISFRLYHAISFNLMGHWLFIKCKFHLASYPHEKTLRKGRSESALFPFISYISLPVPRTLAL